MYKNIYSGTDAFGTLDFMFLCSTLICTLLSIVDVFITHVNVLHNYVSVTVILPAEVLAEIFTKNSVNTWIQHAPLISRGTCNETTPSINVHILYT